mgnify:CR=1 FL=1
MITQQFEQISDRSQLSLVVDMLRYENAAQSHAIQSLEDEIALLTKKLAEQQAEKDILQSVIDFQSAELYIRGEEN